MDILPQTPEMVVSDWDYFAHAIKTTARKVGESYTADQVYQVALNGDASVFYVYEDGVRRGLLVLTDYVDKYTSKTVLHVDIAYLTGPKLIHELEVLINQIVNEHQFDRFEFRSPRKGWFKYLTAAGFEASATFSKEFNYG